MKNTTLAISALVTLSAVQGASAAIAVFTNFSVWNTAVSDNEQTVAVETFNSYGPGTASSLSGSPLPASGITWTATAPTNGLVTDGATVRTAAATDALVFDFAPGVQGIGGNIYTSVLGASSFAFIQVTLADGTANLDKIKTAKGRKEWLAVHKPSLNKTTYKALSNHVKVLEKRNQDRRAAAK